MFNRFLDAAKREGGRALPDLRQNTDARFQILLRNIFDQLMPELLRRLENGIKHTGGTLLQVNRFAAPVCG